jgi:hypothetical protein
VTLPFTVQLTIAYPEKGAGRAHVAFDIASPVSARATNIFVAARNFDAHIPDEEIIAYDLSIAAEDRPIVEGQRRRSSRWIWARNCTSRPTPSPSST